MEKRIEWIDIAKGIGIWLMLYNHISLNLGQDSIKFVIASFHMPLFFLLSGLTLSVNNEGNGKTVLIAILKRFVTIMLPYIIWACIFAYGITAKSIFMIAWSNNESLRIVSNNAALWFLPCLFAASVIAYVQVFVISKLTKNNIWFMFAAVANFLIGGMLTRYNGVFGEISWPFSLNNAFIGCGYILIGLLIKAFFTHQVNEKLSWVRGITSKPLILVSIFCSLFLTISFAYMNVEATSNSYGRVIMARSMYGNMPLFVLSGVFGSVTVVLVSMLIQNVVQIKVLKECLCRIGRETLVILAIHNLILSVVEKLYELIGIEKFGIMFSIIISIVVLALSYCFAIITKYIAPILAGENKEIIIRIRNIR